MTRLKRIVLSASFACAIPASTASAQIFVTTRGGDDAASESVLDATVDGADPSILIRMDSVFGEAVYGLGGIAVSGLDLFWTDVSGFIYTAGLDGSDPRVLIDMREISNRTSPAALTASGDQLYWADRSDDTIFTAEIDGTNPRELISLSSKFGERFDGYAPSGLHVVGSQLYWVDFFTDALYAMGLDGSNARLLFRLETLFGSGVDYGPAGLASSGSRLFIADFNGAIYAVELDGGNPTKLIDLEAVFGHSEFAPQGLAISENQLHWPDFRQDAVFTAGLDGSNPRKLFDTPLPEPVSIAIAPPFNFDSPQLNVKEATELRWQSELGINYQVQVSQDGMIWQDEGTLIAGTGAEIFVLRQSSADRQHRRVAVRPSLLGESINVSGAAIAPSSATINAEIEFNGIFGSLYFDFDGSHLTITQNPEQPTGGWSGTGTNVFSGFESSISDVTVAENEGFEGAIVENFTFTPHTISFDFDPLSKAGTKLVFEIQTVPDSVEDAFVSNLTRWPAIDLHWNSQIDVNYHLQLSPDLTSWLSEPLPIVGTGGSMSILRAMDAARLYYRLRLSN